MEYYKGSLDGQLKTVETDDDDFATDDYLDRSYAVIADGFFLSETVEFQLYERTCVIKPGFYEYILIVGNNVCETIVFDNIIAVMAFFQRLDYSLYEELEV